MKSILSLQLSKSMEGGKNHLASCVRKIAAPLGGFGTMARPLFSSPSEVFGSLDNLDSLPVA